MTKTIALLTIHGMGETDEDYYVDFYDLIKKSTPKSAWKKVIFKPLYYQNILQFHQAEIFNRMRAHIDWIGLRKFLLYGFSDAASLEHKRNEIGSPYYQTQQMIVNAMDEVFEEAGNKEIPVIILAQSLGCQAISNYIWDANKGEGTSQFLNDVKNMTQPDISKDNFRRMKTLALLYTTGCNIPIFVAGHAKIEAIKRPSEAFRWFNFYDRDDVLGWPLKPLSTSYEELVEDIELNAGGGVIDHIIHSWNPLSHSDYWTNGKVINHIAEAIERLA